MFNKIIINKNNNLQKNKKSNINNDIFDIFINKNINSISNQATNNNSIGNNPFENFDFSNNTYINESNNPDKPKKIFENESEFPTTNISICYKKK